MSELEHETQEREDLSLIAGTVTKSRLYATLDGIWEELTECVANLEHVDMDAVDGGDRDLIEGTLERLNNLCDLLEDLDKQIHFQGYEERIGI